MVFEPKEPVRHRWKVQWCYWGRSARDSGDSQTVKDTLQRHTQTIALLPYLKEMICKTLRLQDYFLSKTPKYPSVPYNLGSRECYSPWTQGWTEPTLTSSLISHSHYAKPTSIFTWILYREGCTNQDISLLLSTSSHLWLLWITLALPFPWHKSSLLQNRARLQRRHLSLYFLL